MATAQTSAVKPFGADDFPVVAYLEKVLIEAVKLKASDLHFEPFEHLYRVRLRIDGELREVPAPTWTLKDKLASRIKVLSKMDIAEKRLPQDGRMKLPLPNGSELDLRVSTLPTLFGEKLVIRILSPEASGLSIDQLGYEVEEKERLLKAIRRPHGMVLVTGPTGSGKTQSLYACLNLLNTPEVNIATVEDPSEIHLQGVNQVNVHDKAGLTFAVALRAFLRQDPDVLMVGEVRDLETADIAIKAAQTGHLVLSTLHTNDAPSTLSRLRNMGIAPYNIVSSIALITAQRLVRRLCAHCKKAETVDVQILRDAGLPDQYLQALSHIYKPMGCKHCHKGFSGRVGIFQVMPISDAIAELILQEASAPTIAIQAQREGVLSLRQSGLRKVLQGITSLDEVIAASSDAH
jgi:type IV pilus assembly protein PilB